MNADKIIDNFVKGVYRNSKWAHSDRDLTGKRIARLELDEDWQLISVSRESYFITMYDLIVISPEKCTWFFEHWETTGRSESDTSSKMDIIETRVV
jgi:hypothetical protein